MKTYDQFLEEGYAGNRNDFNVTVTDVYKVEYNGNVAFIKTTDQGQAKSKGAAILGGTPTKADKVKVSVVKKVIRDKNGYDFATRTGNINTEKTLKFNTKYKKSLTEEAGWKDVSSFKKNISLADVEKKIKKFAKVKSVTATESGGKLTIKIGDDKKPADIDDIVFNFASDAGYSSMDSWSSNKWEFSK